MRTLLLVIVIMLFVAPAPALAADIRSYAFVNDDGSLRIRGHTIHLYGIIIPAIDETCLRFIRPIRCGPRAALALDFKIGARFVGCNIKDENPDGSLVGICWINDQDLAAYLLERGWAAALPDAPAEYAVLERIARSRGVGMWGFPVDPPVIRFR